MNGFRMFFHASIAASALFLAACAGGDESPVGEIVERADEEISNVIEVLGKSDDCYQRDLLVDDFIAAVNAARAETQMCQGVAYPAASPLSWNLRLQNAAVNHSDDMAGLDFFSHTGSDGLSGGARADGQGYIWTRIGENLAGGYASPESVVDAWLDSTDGHCENLMNPLMRETGGSCKSGGLLNLYSNYWTLLLAATE